MCCRYQKYKCIKNYKFFFFWGGGIVYNLPIGNHSKPISKLQAIQLFCNIIKISKV